MMSKNDKEERRRSRRVATSIYGRLVYPGVDTECFIKQMSATGALIATTPMPALHVPVALDVPGIGFASGTSVRYSGGLLCIRLHPTMSHEQFMADRLNDPTRRVLH